jgi:hypothetical protein
MMSDREYVEKLLKLMDENPGMRVMVRIDGEGITSEYDWWKGRFHGEPEVRTYVTDYDGSIIERSDDYYDDCFRFYGLEADDWDDEELKRKDAEIPWEKAITVSVSATEKEAMA